MTPGLKQPKEVWGKEIVALQALQALSSIPTVVKSEDLQSLVHEITSIVEEAKTWTSMCEETDETHGEWVTSKAAECFQTLQNEGGQALWSKEPCPSSIF